ncbi:MAG: hypothetical protein AB1331_04730 [Bacillota bacterium]
MEDANCRAVFEYGKEATGTREASQLCVEADGVVVGLQRSENRRAEVKLVAGYKAKKEERPSRKRLEHRLAVAGTGSEEEIWEEAVGTSGQARKKMESLRRYLEDKTGMR